MTSAFSRLGQRFRALFTEPADEAHQVCSQRQNLLLGHFEPAGHKAARLERQILQIKSLWTKPNSNFALIGGSAFPLDELHALQPFDERRQGPAIEHQPPADIRNRDAVFFPQHDENEVLRVRQLHRPKRLAIRLGHRARRCIKCKVKLIVEAKQLSPALVRTHHFPLSHRVDQTPVMRGALNPCAVMAGN